MKDVKTSLNTFLSHPTITSVLGNPQSHPSDPSLHTVLNGINNIKSTLQSLQHMKATTTKPNNTPPKAPPPTAGQVNKQNKPPGSTPPTFAKAAALPPHPSVVISLADIDWQGERPNPPTLCSSINDALNLAQNDQVHISAVRWTVCGNLILMGSPNTLAHQLQLAIPTIQQHLAEHHLDLCPTDPPLTIRPNVKWSKILINSVPTGVSPTSPAKSPDECHQALITENPSYASLSITQ
ncbi:hypothetical protein H4582DRAFT_2063032 [Lactarius indigo]|nr:hypothetical protein H4582DRAFT_2063032 [Lactarius indigo]